MPRLVHATPKYRRHRASGHAVVTLNGRDHYLGPWGSPESKAAYDRLISEWLASHRDRPPDRPEPDLTVTELVASYYRFARCHYRKNGQPTGTMHNVRAALRYLRRTYGDTPAARFGPLALKTVRDQMIQAGLSRTYINASVGRIKRVFKWAASEELVPVTVYQSLATVTGLQKGRTEAREPDPVEPVPDEVVDATLPHLSSVVADMVRFHRLVGCRPSEVCLIRPRDVDRSGEVWVYRPESYKTEHHGGERRIFIGPKAQDVLRPYLLRPAESYCFSPAESVKKRFAERHANRRTPLSCGITSSSKLL
jgi:integrase